jgi:hypothetical protein
LGLPAPERAADNEEPLLEEEEEEDADAAGTESRRLCPVCHTGVLVEITWPRPTIARIMQMPLEQLRQFRLPFQ